MSNNFLLIGGSGFVGSAIVLSLRRAGFNVCAPSHNKLDLRSINSIKSFLQNKSFTCLIYCAIDNVSDDFVNTNLINLKHILFFKHYFTYWVHISSRAVYDASLSYTDILPIPIHSLHKPSNSIYSTLKYEEEKLLNAEKLKNLAVFRLFDISIKYDFSDLKQRWLKQVRKKGYCKNEILTPIFIDDLCDEVVRLISNNCCGTYNVCGRKKIGSYDILHGYISDNQIEENVYEHTGSFVIFQNINQQYLKDYYHCFENRNVPLTVCSLLCDVQGIIYPYNAMEYFESGILKLSKESLKAPRYRQSDISSTVSLLSVLPAFLPDMEAELLKLSENAPIYLDANKEDLKYISDQLTNINFFSGANSQARFKTMNCNLVVSTGLSNRLSSFIFAGARKVLLEDLLCKILLRIYLPYLKKNFITPLFIDGPRKECLHVNKQTEPYLYQHCDLEEVLQDKEYVKSFYRNNRKEIAYAYDDKSGILTGNSITSNGIHLMSAFFRSNYLNIDTEGIRTTVNSLESSPSNNIWIFGSCLSFGLFSTDEYTFPSQLQKKINSRDMNMQVKNMGVKGRNNILNDIIFSMNTSMRSGDYVVFVEKFNSTIKEIIVNENMSVMDFSNYLNLVELNPHNFLNSTFHANLEIYQHLADFTSQFIIKQKVVKYFVKPFLYESKLNLKIDSTKLLDMAFLKYYLDNIKKYRFQTTNESVIGSIVMAANPFTLGHAGIIDIIANECDFFYVFVIEDSDFYYSFEQRIEMVRKYCSIYKNCCVLPSGNFFGASFLFPEYHMKDEYQDKPIKPPYMDTLVYAKMIAPLLGINRRYVGAEPFDRVTDSFHKYLEKVLPLYNIEVKIIDRIKDCHNLPISGTKVRKLLSNCNYSVNELLKYVPKSTLSVLSISHDLDKD